MIFVGITSFGLYADWREYGLLMPQAIKEKKKAAAEEARKAELDAARAAKEAKKKAAAGEKASTKSTPAKGGIAKAPTADGAAKAGASAEETPDAEGAKSDYQKEVEEVRRDKPTDSEVDLDSDLGLEE
jgi:hypothetical protein